MLCRNRNYWYCQVEGYCLLTSVWWTETVARTWHWNQTTGESFPLHPLSIANGVLSATQLKFAQSSWQFLRQCWLKRGKRWKFKITGDHVARLSIMPTFVLIVEIESRKFLLEVYEYPANNCEDFEGTRPFGLDVPNVLQFWWSEGRHRFSFCRPKSASQRG